MASEAFREMEAALRRVRKGGGYVENELSFATGWSCAVEACAAEVEAAGCTKHYPCYYSGDEMVHGTRCPIVLAARLRRLA